MKPLKLKMKNFGPYKDAEVDFTKFSEAPLFLITGATGSGKTTIFDAMCFALYGQSSTDKDRNVFLLRSDFVKDCKEKTEVELTFSHQGKEYTVNRSFYQTKGNKEKGEFTKKASLRYHDENGTSIELTKLNEINIKVTSLLNLNAEQFSKIILLPQGKFKEFLMSDSSKKEKILSQIFGTDFYDDWVSEIKKQADEAKSDSDETKKELLFEQKQAVFSETEPEAEPFEDWFDALDLQIKSDEENCAKAKEAEEETQKKVNEALKKMALAERLEQDFQEFEEVSRKKELLKREQAKINEQTNYLAELNWAFGCETMVFRKKTAQKRLEELRADIEKQNDEFFKTKEKFSKALETKQSLLQEAPQKDKAQADFNLWQGRVGIYDEAEQKNAELADLQIQADKSSKKLAEKKAGLERKIASKNDLDKFIEKNSGVADEKHRLELEIQQLKEDEKKLQDYKAQQQKAEVLKNEQVVLEKASAEASELQKTAEQEYENIQSQWAKLQINELAKLLKPGEACPVCGSLEHPSPAFGDEETVSVTENQVKKAKEKHDEAVADASEKKAKADAKSKEFSERQADFLEKITEFSRSLGYDTIEIIELEKKLDAKRSASEEKLSQARETARKRTEAEVKLKTLQTEIERGEELVSDLKQELSECQATISGKKAGLAELEKQLPKQFKTRKELQEQLNQWDEFVKKYDADKAKNDKEVSDLDKKRASLQSLIEKENINLGNESNLLHASEKEIESACLKKGISAERLYELLEEKDRIPRLSVKSATFRKKKQRFRANILQGKRKSTGRFSQTSKK